MGSVLSHLPPGKHTWLGWERRYGDLSVNSTEGVLLTRHIGTSTAACLTAGGEFVIKLFGHKLVEWIWSKIGDSISGDLFEVL